jgi:PTH1 family peptidyl-tRNA hydrolase
MQLLKRIFKKKPPSPDMKKFLIVGLGNIGLEYYNTRHNVGFKILDHVAEKNKALWEVKKLASYSSFKKKGKKFVMIKPNTFMNRSGKSVKYWALKEKINIENILIITDDLHLPFGTLRLRGKGSAAGHNGLKDIESELNTPNYARLRFGIGQQNKPFDQVKFVLDKWNKNEEKDITKRIDVCTEIAIAFGLEGLSNTMNKFNGK